MEKLNLPRVIIRYDLVTGNLGNTWKDWDSNMLVLSIKKEFGFVVISCD